MGGKVTSVFVCDAGLSCGRVRRLAPPSSAVIATNLLSVTTTVGRRLVMAPCDMGAGFSSVTAREIIRVWS